MKPNYYLYLLTLMVSFGVSPLHAQFIKNPSFEGRPANGQVPDGWTICGYASSPDTQPGIWNVNKDPSHGDTYVSLVIRGYVGPNRQRKEDIRTHLLQPLLPGGCYQISLDAAVSPNFGHDSSWGWISYNNPVKLEVFGGATFCGKDELLFEIDSIGHNDWRTYTYEFQVMDTTLNYLLFFPEYITADRYFGNLLLDNIQFTDLQYPVTQMDTVVTYNTALTLAPTAGASYQWSDNLEYCNNCANPEIRVTKNEEYSVTITHVNGCESVNVFKVAMEVQVPNVFTPNGDGMNDYFTVYGELGRLKFTVYNRWGLMVFQSASNGINWDGRSANGERLPSGVYYYQLDFEESQKSQTGYVHLSY